MSEAWRINVKKLPQLLVVEDGQQREVYQIQAAGRKFGASLQKLSGDVRERILRTIDKK